MSEQGATYRRVGVLVNGVAWEVPEAVAAEIERLKLLYHAACALLAEAQQREAWWRELVARMQPNMQMSTTRYDELRALLLGLSAAPGGEE